MRVLECWRASDLPPPCFLKVCDFVGDEVGCFDRDLDVLMVRELQFMAERYWALVEG